MSNNNSSVTKADLEAMEQRTAKHFEAMEQRTVERFEAMEQRTAEKFEQLTHYIDERTRDMQTELLRGFRSYQEGVSVRLAKLTADVSNVDTSTDRRIAIVEERLRDLEHRITQKGL